MPYEKKKEGTKQNRVMKTGGKEQRAKPTKGDAKLLTCPAA